MVEGKVDYSDRISWNHTSAVMGLLHNCHAKKPVGFDHYNPYVKKKTKAGATKLDKSTIDCLKPLAHKGRGLKKHGKPVHQNDSAGEPQRQPRGAG